jgi:hypothetical protein
MGSVQGAFNFTVINLSNQQTLGPFQLTVGQCTTVTAIGPGQFNITESENPDTTLVSVIAIAKQGDGTIVPGALVSSNLSTRSATVIVFESATTTVTFTNAPHKLGNQGCTPGYFKQSQHFDSWVNYTPSATVGSVFTGVIASLSSETLLSALQGGGGPGLLGAETILLRAAVAALLNASNPNVSYALTALQVITEVNTALSTGDRDTILALASTLDGFNNGQGGCPLN